MADWGKINGDRIYGVITFDMDRAFALAGLREYEAIVIQVMREHSWGPARKKAKGEPWPDATPYNPPLYALAKSLGVPLPRLSEAKARLLASNILIPAAEGFLINKEADQWTDPTTGAPRLTDMQIAYALAAPKRSAPVTRKRNQCPGDQVTPDRNKRLRENVTSTPVQVTPDRNQWLRQSVTTPIEKHARDSEEFQKIKEPAGKPAGRGAHAGEAEPFDTPVKPGEVPEIITGPGPDDPEIKALAEWAAQTRGEYSGWVLASSPYAPARWIRSLLARKVVGKKTPANVPLLAHILGVWIDKGKPEWDIDADPTPGPATGAGPGRSARIDPEVKRKSDAIMALMYPPKRRTHES